MKKRRWGEKHKDNRNWRYYNKNLSEEERHIFPWISLRPGKKNWTK